MTRCANCQSGKRFLVQGTAYCLECGEPFRPAAKAIKATRRPLLKAEQELPPAAVRLYLPAGHHHLFISRVLIVLLSLAVIGGLLYFYLA